MTQDSESVVVPRVPTIEMLASWWRQKNCGSQDLSVRFGEGDAFSDYDAYAAMLAAAPSTSVREEVDAAQIDAGARYLREVQQSGKKLTPWAETPKATKKKWLALSEGVLRAALMPSPDEGKRHG